jgi:phage-related protein
VEYFIFNGINSNTKGIEIKKMPPITSPKKDIESIKVDGRNGNLHIDNGMYDTYDLTIECIVTDLTKINEIKAYLTGIGVVELSTIPNVEFDCVIKNQIPIDKYLNVIREFPLLLEVNPIGKSKTLTTVTKTEDGTFTVAGTFGVAPILEIKGTGDGSVTLNGTTINITDMSDTAIIIDCDLMNAIQGVDSANSQIDCDKFPSLVIGENTISMIGATEVKIKYKVGWL